MWTLFNVSRQVINWVDNFLSDRSQSVVVNGTKSAPAPVLSGVPQGSVLGPVLFLSYIKDIVEAASSDVRLFADDVFVIGSLKITVTAASRRETLLAWASGPKPGAWDFIRQSVMLCLLLGNIVPEFLSIPSAGLIWWGGTLLSTWEWSSPRISVGEITYSLFVIKETRSSACYVGTFVFVPRKLNWQPIKVCLGLCWSMLVLFGIHIRRHFKIRRSVWFITNEYLCEGGSVTTLLKDLGLGTLSDRRRRCRLQILAKGIHG